VNNMKKFLIFLARELLHLCLMLLIAWSYIYGIVNVSSFISNIINISSTKLALLVIICGVAKMYWSTHSKYVYEFINLFWKEKDDTTL